MRPHPEEIATVASPTPNSEAKTAIVSRLA